MRHPYADFVERVAKPGRYLGGEYMSVIKSHDECDVSIVLAFPDVYDIGMSHLGTKILYSILNKHPQIVCERSFAPWPDMEAELRSHNQPLRSLESARSLAEFDVIGMSLQYELTYTNCLQILDLSGLPLRSKDRTDDMPLILGGGSTATHPEPMAPFFDAFFIGEGEEALPDLLLVYKSLRKRGLSKRDALIRCAQRGALYVPSLYETATCSESGLEYVARPTEPNVPARVTRAWVQDLGKFPFPDDSPVPITEAIFDRAAVEIARGCTEGCRFCQAGMIFRPVRERAPEQVIDAVLGNVRKGGYDETAITSLSTADYSCVTPLVSNLMKKLREEKASLAVSSLRAYGLNEELLDEMSTVRATGLTFAPEAGTQRMRDVVNKNITEQHVTESAERIFSRGWTRMKLYFMIGLPTELDEDVEGIVNFGHRVRKIGRTKCPSAEVTVSVSSHVPKPHTPFQWCAQDLPDEIVRKQTLLSQVARKTKTELKVHDSGMSHVEGWLSRGDRKMADVIEWVYRDGARFDSWDEWFSLTRWQRAVDALQVDVSRYMGTIPVTAKLPWDHIDVGLADGFLLDEYRRALKDRLSPPCGKVVGKLIHATHVEEALAETKPLVCYDCGVACDMTQMREERLVFLRSMGSIGPRQRPAHALPVIDDRTTVPVPDGVAATPANAVTLSPSGIDLAHVGVGIQPDAAPQKSLTKVPRVMFTQREGTRFRLRFTKLGRAAFMSHLDLNRTLVRIARRAKFELIYSQGFHPKPWIIFSPALALGIQSLGEYCDVKIGGVDEDEFGPLGDDELCRRLTAVAPDGLCFEAARRLNEGDRPLSHVIGKSWFAAQLVGADLAALQKTMAVRRLGPLLVTRGASGDAGGGGKRGTRRPPKQVDVGAHATRFELCNVTDRPELSGLDWNPADGPALLMEILTSDDGSAKPSEVVEALFGITRNRVVEVRGKLPQATSQEQRQFGVTAVRYARLALLGADGRTDPLDLEHHRRFNLAAQGVQLTQAHSEAGGFV